MNYYKKKEYWKSDDSDVLLIKNAKTSKIFRWFCQNNDLVYGKMFDEMLFYYLKDNKNVPKFILEPVLAKRYESLGELFRDSNETIEKEVKEVYYFKKGIMNLIVNGANKNIIKRYLINIIFIVKNHHPSHSKNNEQKMWDFIEQMYPHRKRYITQEVCKLILTEKEAKEERFVKSLKRCKEEVQRIIKGRYSLYGKDIEEENEKED